MPTETKVSEPILSPEQVATFINGLATGVKSSIAHFHKLNRQAMSPTRNEGREMTPTEYETKVRKAHVNVELAARLADRMETDLESLANLLRQLTYEVAMLHDTVVNAGDKDAK